MTMLSITAWPIVLIGLLSLFIVSAYLKMKEFDMDNKQKCNR